MSPYTKRRRAPARPRQRLAANRDERLETTPRTAMSTISELVITDAPGHRATRQWALDGP